MHALVQRIYPWPQLRMLYRIGYPHCQCEVRDGDVKALYIRDRISRTHSIIHGELHAQDSDLHKLHARSHEHNHHHVWASKHDHQDVDQNHLHHSQCGVLRDNNHQLMELQEDEYLPMLVRNVVKSDDDNLAHDPSLVQKNRVVQAQNPLQFQLDDQAQNLFQYQ